MYNPWVKKGIKLGSAQAGTFVFSEIDADGLSSKVIVDDVSVNSPLLPPSGATDAVLAGGVNIEVTMDEDHTPTVIEKEGRMRTVKIIIRTRVSPLTPGAYGKAGKAPTSAPSDQLPK